MASKPDNRLLTGVVLGAHGVRGAVRIKSFTEMAADLAAYGTLETEDGRPLTVTLTGEVKGVLTASIQGVGDRNAAEALKGLKLYLGRDALPAISAVDEFYVADLVGLEARLLDGRVAGRVKAVFDFGAGDVLEIEGPDEMLPGGALMLPFTRRAVPTLCIEEGWLAIDPPAEIDGSEDGDG